MCSPSPSSSPAQCTVDINDVLTFTTIFIRSLYNDHGYTLAILYNFPEGIEWIFNIVLPVNLRTEKVKGLSMCVQSLKSQASNLHSILSKCTGLVLQFSDPSVPRSPDTYIA